MDASPFTWTANQKWSLHGGIDDATGKITGLYFCKEECLDGYFTITKQMLSSHGIPVAIYADRHTIFQSPKNAKLTIEDELLGKKVAYTQFGRACSELGIVLIPARSPQAKGRIERLWETLQDRLVLEMRLAGITTIEEANLFLLTFIDRFNARFAVVAENSELAYRAAPLDLDTILCRKVDRKVDSGAVFSYGGNKYQIIDQGRVLCVKPRASIKVLDSPSFGIKAQYDGAIYSVKEFTLPLKESDKKKSEHKSLKPDKRLKPSKDHPWRAGLPYGLWYDKDGVACKAFFNSTSARL